MGDERIPISKVFHICIMYYNKKGGGGGVAVGWGMDTIRTTAINT